MDSIKTVSDVRKNHPPLIRTEHKGVQITIAFSEDAPERNIKKNPRGYADKIV